jgi:hypothetical protein
MKSKDSIVGLLFGLGIGLFQWGLRDVIPEKNIFILSLGVAALFAAVIHAIWQK